MELIRFLDGWTTDRKESTINLLNEVAPIVGTTVKVAITCIRSVDDFYIHIPEISAQYNPSSLNELKNKMNVPEMVKQYKPCVDKPSKHYAFHIKFYSFILLAISTCNPNVRNHLLIL